jgi:hypothetical protein
VLLAYVDGELRVAVGSDGAAVADPFHFTADVVELVRAQAALGRRRARAVPGLIGRLAPMRRGEARA